MTVKDISPTEKEREIKAERGELEHETKERKRKKEKSGLVEEKPGQEAVTEAKEAEKKKSGAKEAKKKTKEKKEKKPKPVEKIKYREKKEGQETKLKKKKPKFRRQEHYKKRLSLVWRTSRGIDSKKHEGKRGKGKAPSVGYKNPNALQGLHPLGYQPVLIHNLKELAQIKPETEAAIIASAVGRRKRNEMIKEANKSKITILNPRKGET